MAPSVRFVSKCDYHGEVIDGPQEYLDHREQCHGGIDFTLVWERPESGKDGSTTVGGLLAEGVRLLRRALGRGAGE